MTKLAAEQLQLLKAEVITYIVNKYTGEHKIKADQSTVSHVECDITMIINKYKGYELPNLTTSVVLSGTSLHISISYYDENGERVEL